MIFALRLPAALALAALVPLAACSSNGSPAAASDAGVVDGAIGPVFCGLPVAATCPVTAPCSVGGWACAPAVCDGYFAITDGTWAYYYSAPGGELAGEVLLADASFVSCPYGFIPPASCVPVAVSQPECADGGATVDGG